MGWDNEIPRCADNWRQIHPWIVKPHFGRTHLATRVTSRLCHNVGRTCFASPCFWKLWCGPVVLKLENGLFSPWGRSVAGIHRPRRWGEGLKSTVNVDFTPGLLHWQQPLQLAMALCGGVGAMALPSELIVHIFSFLSDRDKLRASAVCSRWRECLFYPALWTELKLRIGGSDETSKLEFLMRKFGSFVRELQLELAPGERYLSLLNGGDPSSSRMDQPPVPDNDPQLSERWRDAITTYLDQVLCVFTHIRNNRWAEQKPLAFWLVRLNVRIRLTLAFHPPKFAALRSKLAAS